MNQFKTCLHAALLLALTLALAACLQSAPETSGPLFQPADYGEFPATGKSFGATWADVDGDGQLDLLLDHHGHGVGLYTRGPGLHFVRRDSCAYLPCENIDQHGTAACDIDADGVWEFYVTVGADRGEGTGDNEMWIRSDGRYRNLLTPGHTMADSHGRGRGATWLRLDEDRYPELLVLNYKSPARLFKYDGGAWHDLSLYLDPFADSSAPRGKGRGRGAWFSVAAAADFDRDGRTDLFLAGDGAFLLRNDAAEGLRDVTKSAGLKLPAAGLVGAETGDVDNDGDPDLLLVTRWVGGLTLWLNESTPGRPRFRPGPSLAHLPLGPERDSAFLADLDNDGRLDLYVMQQDREKNNLPNLVAKGLGNGDFSEVSAEWGGLGAVEALPRGTWPVDLDRDGDLDLVLIHGKENFPERRGIVVLYENSATNAGLTLALEVPDGAPHGLGAEVVLHTRSGPQTRQVQSTITHWNSTILPLHFGLGEDPGPYRATVRWPDGRRQQVTLPRGRAAYVLRQGDAAAKTVVDISSR